MRLAISNIAWRPAERFDIYRQLVDSGANGLEIAPGQAFPNEPDAFEPGKDAVLQFRDEMDVAGLTLVSMQSLLFGLANAKLFGTPVERETFELGLARAIRLAGQLEIPNLVMGSPGNRAIPDGLERETAELSAIDMFRRLGDLCLPLRTKLALEPNAAAYGTNFLNTVAETAAFARRVAHPAVTVNFDLGALHMNDEFARGGALFAQACDLMSHVHVSEAGLALAPADGHAFQLLAADLLKAGYKGWFSIEMRATSENNVPAVSAALKRTGAALLAAEQMGGSQA